MVGRDRELRIGRRLAATAVVAPIGAFAAFVFAAVIDAERLSVALIVAWVIVLGIVGTRDVGSSKARALLLVATICMALLAIAAAAFAWYEIACGSQGCFD